MIDRCLILILFFLLGFEPENFSQFNNCQCTSKDMNEKNFEEKIIARIFINQMIGNNNQYFNAWTSGDIYLNDGCIIKNELLRYNTYTGDLLWLRKADYQTGVVNKQVIMGFTLYDQNNLVNAKFKKIKTKNWYSGDSANIFFQVLAEGQISLYANRKSQSLKNTNEIIEKDEYYLLKNGVLSKFTPNRYSLYRIMGEEKPNMRLVIRSEHLRVRKEPQLIRAIELYNKNSAAK
jgi:hypothetical protein